MSNFLDEIITDIGQDYASLASNIDETEEYIEEITRENQPKYHLIRSVACGAVGSETYVNIQQQKIMMLLLYAYI